MGSVFDDTGEWDVILAEEATLSSSHCCPRMTPVVMTGAAITPSISTTPVSIIVRVDPIPVVYAARPVQVVHVFASVRPIRTTKRVFMRTWRERRRASSRSPRAPRTRRVVRARGSPSPHQGDVDAPPDEERGAQLARGGVA